MTPTADFTSDASRWQALIQRGSRADGRFVYGVMTTGIYCRPTCSSRRPNRENVRFFENWQMAEHDGSHPCRRCRPREYTFREASVELVSRACVIIEESGHEPSLNELADAASLSPHHFHRLFRKVAGITPTQYAMELRLRRMRKNLKKNRTITESVYESGYESNSRFYETAAKDLGMKPSTFRKGGEGMSIRYGIVQSYLGWLLIATTELGISVIGIDDSPEVLDNRLRAAFPGAVFREKDPEFTTTIAGMLSFIEEPGQGRPLPLDIQGTAFQWRVWAALQSSPAGSTISYSELAQRIGKPKAVRAVARACAANHLAVAVPCYRVVLSAGELGGYRWGLDRKKHCFNGSRPSRNKWSMPSGATFDRPRREGFLSAINRIAGFIDKIPCQYI